MDPPSGNSRRCTFIEMPFARLSREIPQGPDDKRMPAVDSVPDRFIGHGDATYHDPTDDLHRKFAERARAPSELQTQRSQTWLAHLRRERGIHPKTAAKWRKRATIEDLKTGPKEPPSTVLSEAEEAAIVAFRCHTLPLGGCLYDLQPAIPYLTRSGLQLSDLELNRLDSFLSPAVGGEVPSPKRSMTSLPPWHAARI